MDTHFKFNDEYKPLPDAGEPGNFGIGPANWEPHLTISITRGDRHFSASGPKATVLEEYNKFLNSLEGTQPKNLSCPK